MFARKGGLVDFSGVVSFKFLRNLVEIDLNGVLRLVQQTVALGARAIVCGH
jgi:hypothetical protein